MSLQPLQLVNVPHVRIVGEVTIHPSAAIAPGTILQAAPDSQIIIAAGVCVGMGTILNAYGGKIELETGVSLGAGVLVVGRSKIGANTCIGGATTIYNADLDALQVIPAGSVLGDPSRRVELISDRETSLPTSEMEDLWASEPEEITEIPSTDLAEETTVETAPQSPQKQPGTPVFGKVYVNQLLLTLFPQGHGLTQQPPNSS
jgi:carbon dioxide concentrating mechanism protein CcmN